MGCPSFRRLRVLIVDWTAYRTFHSDTFPQGTLAFKGACLTTKVPLISSSLLLLQVSCLFFAAVASSTWTLSHKLAVPPNLNNQVLFHSPTSSCYASLTTPNSMGETEGKSTNGAEHANSTSDSSTIGGQDDQPPVAEPPDIPGSGSTSNSEKPSSFPHTLSALRVAQDLNSDIQNGLSYEEAAVRFVRDGPNAIQGAKGISLWQIFLQQIANALTAVLIAVTALSFAIQDYIEGGVVVAVILLNIVVGYVRYALLCIAPTICSLQVASTLLLVR